MICVKFNGATNPKVIQDVIQPDGSCTDYTLLSYPEFAALHGQIPPPEILYAYSWGFGAILMMWALGYSVGVGVQLIKKL